MTKAKKAATTVSWRTLVRRANAATKRGHKQEATRLREQASSLRRDERAAAKQAPAGNADPKIDFAPRKGFSTVTGEDGPRDSGIMIPTRDEAKSWGWKVPEEPGHGEIVGGEVAKLADTLAALARKKGGTDEVQAELARMLATARYEGQKAAEEIATMQRAAAREAIDERIVCGFIAEVDMAQQRYHGLPPDMVWNLNSLTVTKIVDALNRAGYTAKGKK